MDNSILISFQNATDFEKSQYAQELAEVIRNASDSVEVTISKDADTLDIGTAILVNFVSGLMVTAVSEAIKIWLINHQETELEIKTKETKFTVKGSNPKEITKIIELLVKEGNKDNT